MPDYRDVDLKAWLAQALDFWLTRTEGTPAEQAEILPTLEALALTSLAFAAETAVFLDADPMALLAFVAKHYHKMRHHHERPPARGVLIIPYAVDTQGGIAEQYTQGIRIGPHIDRPADPATPPGAASATPGAPTEAATDPIPGMPPDTEAQIADLRRIWQAQTPPPNTSQD